MSILLNFWGSIYELYKDGEVVTTKQALCGRGDCRARSRELSNNQTTNVERCFNGTKATRKRQ